MVIVAFAHAYHRIQPLMQRDASASRKCNGHLRIFHMSQTWARMHRRSILHCCTVCLCAQGRRSLQAPNHTTVQLRWLTRRRHRPTCSKTELEDQCSWVLCAWLLLLQSSCMANTTATFIQGRSTDRPSTQLPRTPHWHRGMPVPDTRSPEWPPAQLHRRHAPARLPQRATGVPAGAGGA